MNFPEVFQLTTKFVEDKGLTLEGNGGLDPKNTLDGAAFMSAQQNASGEMWKTIPIGDGYFFLTTLFVADKGLTLEGNGGLDPKNTLDGAAFMSAQKNATGEMWKVLPLDNGYFQLTSRFLEDKTSRFLEDKGLVLEGNGGFDPKNTLGGAAFMSPQRNATGTMWKVIPR